MRLSVARHFVAGYQEMFARHVGVPPSGGSCPNANRLKPGHQPQHPLPHVGRGRDNSKDSRYFGVVERRLIVGKANAVIASVDKNGSYLPRFGRFFSALR
ncbi:MAG: S26 family signal peptidase [Verrucomicrobia bacterium]|nr:S26 family signal peptidase [Verrucomicrobiota bacterium]